MAAAGRLSAGAGRGREREIKKRKITFAAFSSHFLISSSEIKSSPAYGRQRSAAGSKRPGAYLSVLLCFGTGKRAGEKGKETTIKLFFAGASFFFQLTFSLFRRYPLRPPTTTTTNSPHSSTSVPWAPTCSLRESTSRCVVFFSISFCYSFSPFLHFFSLSLTHLFFSSLSLPLQTKHSPSSTL